MIRRRSLSILAASALVLTPLVALEPAHAVVAPPDHPTISGDQINSFVTDLGGGIRGSGANYAGLFVGSPPDGAVTTLTAMPGLPAGVTVASIDGYSARAVIIGSDDRVYGAGSNYSRQLTGSANLVPPWQPLTGLPEFEIPVEAAVSQSCTVILTQSGKLFRAGAGHDTTGNLGEYGQCPKAPEALANTLSLMPGVPEGRTVVDVALGGSGEESLVAVLDDGSMLATGNENAFDSLPGIEPGNTAALAPLTGLPNGVLAKSVSISEEFIVVLGTTGLVYGAGHNGSSQLTTGSTVNGWHEMALPGAVPAVQVIAGGHTSTVLGNNGLLYASGSITQYDPFASVPSVQNLTLMPNLAVVGPITEIDGQGDNLIVRGTDGYVWGVGNNNLGQLTGAPPNVNEYQRGFWRLTGQINPATTPPTTSGTAKYGQTLTATDAAGWAIEPDSVARQWLRNGVPIDGQTVQTYVIQKADAGKTVSVRNTAMTEFYADTPSTSAGQLIAKQVFNVTRPTITGTAKKGGKLSVKSKGTWTVFSLKYSYRWLRNGVSISGAVSPTYTLKSIDNNKRITVKITVSRSGYIGASAISSNYKAY